MRHKSREHSVALKKPNAGENVPKRKHTEFLLEKTHPRNLVRFLLGSFSPDTKKSVFVRKAHFELPPLTKTDVRNHTKNLSQRKHG